MKMLGIVLMLLLLSACSTTKVHLYTRYLSDHETEVVTKKLQGLGFGVISNSLVFPENIEQSTLVYSPFVEGEDTINILVASLQENGWPIANIEAIFSVITIIQKIVLDYYYYRKVLSAMIKCTDEIW